MSKRLKSLRLVTNDPPEAWPTFTVGEIVELKGYQFKIRKITVRDIFLRPVKDRGEIRFNPR